MTNKPMKLQTVLSGSVNSSIEMGLYKSATQDKIHRALQTVPKKLNIEMFFLADEMFKQKGKNFTIKIGKPIPWQTFNKSKSQTQWAQWVKEIVYKIGLT